MRPQSFQRLDGRVPMMNESKERRAVSAWKELAEGNAQPPIITRLYDRKKEKPKKKSAVFRLHGVGVRGGNVIAKRCRHSTASVERKVYEEILPALPVPTLRFYGFNVDPDPNFAWLFIEDAGDQKFFPREATHRIAAAQWFAVMHTVARRLRATRELPERGTKHFFAHLENGRARIAENLSNPSLTNENRSELGKLLHHFDRLQSRWRSVEETCSQMPETLVHADCTMKNIRVRAEGDGLVFLPFDWEVAGWGVYAVDLLENRMSVDIYSSLIRKTWPTVDTDCVEMAVRMGRLFRCLAAISWCAESLPYALLEETMTNMQIYRLRLSEVIGKLDI